VLPNLIPRAGIVLMRRLGSGMGSIIPEIASHGRLSPAGIRSVALLGASYAHSRSFGREGVQPSLGPRHLKPGTAIKSRESHAKLTQGGRITKKRLLTH